MSSVKYWNYALSKKIYWPIKKKKFGIFQIPPTTHFAIINN